MQKAGKYGMLIVVAGKLQYGDVPKRLKGPHSKCGRSETAQGFKSLHLRESFSGSLFGQKKKDLPGRGGLFWCTRTGKGKIAQTWN